MKNDSCPAWKKPENVQEAYSKGDRVHYPGNDGPVWMSIVDNNVWVPGEYGWNQELDLNWKQLSYRRFN